MALRTFQVTVPASFTSLAALLQALSGWPTLQTAGVTYPMPVGRAAQLILNNDSANTANIQYKATLATASGPGGTVVPGGSANFGSANEVAVDLSQLYVKAATGTALLNVSVVD